MFGKGDNRMYSMIYLVRIYVCVASSFLIYFYSFEIWQRHIMADAFVFCILKTKFSGFAAGNISLFRITTGLVRVFSQKNEPGKLGWLSNLMRFHPVSFEFPFMKRDPQRNGPAEQFFPKLSSDLLQAPDFVWAFVAGE